MGHAIKLCQGERSKSTYVKAWDLSVQISVITLAALHTGLRVSLLLFLLYEEIVSQNLLVLLVWANPNHT